MTVSAFLGPVLARLHASQIVKAVMTAAPLPATGVNGAFFKEPREVFAGQVAVQEVANTFECVWRAELNRLEEGMPVRIDGEPYRFLRWVVRGGDTAALAICELGVYV